MMAVSEPGHSSWHRHFKLLTHRRDSGSPEARARGCPDSLARPGGTYLVGCPLRASV